MRINDLARELEVKSREILEALPELGIEGKRSHSSSLEEDQIEKVKAYFHTGGPGAGTRRSAHEPDDDGDEPTPSAPEAAAPKAPPAAATPPAAAPPAATNPAPVAGPAPVAAHAPVAASHPPAPAASVTPPAHASAPVAHAPAPPAAPVTPSHTAPHVSPQAAPASGSPGTSGRPAAGSPPPAAARPTSPASRMGSRAVLRPPLRQPGAPVAPAAAKPAAPVAAKPVEATPAKPVEAAAPAAGSTPVAAPPLASSPVAAPPLAAPPAETPAVTPSTTPAASSREVVVEEPKAAAPAAPAPPASQQHMPRFPAQGSGPHRPPVGPSRFGNRPSLITGAPAAGSVPPGTIIRRADQMPNLNPPPRPPAPSGPGGPPRPGSRPIYQRPNSNVTGPTGLVTGAPGAPRTYPPSSPRPASPSRAGAPAGAPGAARPYERRPMHPTRARPAGPGAPMLPPPPGGALPPPPSRRPRPGGAGGAPVRDKERAQRRMAPQREPAAVLAPREITKTITITEGITVKDLAEKLGEKAKDLMAMLIRKGILANINQALDGAVATDLARHFGAEAAIVSFEEQAVTEVAEAENPADLVKRPPVVTIMGHVDHGKTSLLDAIRETNVTASEAGGITQHIGVFQVEISGRKISFIDTPGHEAFTRMRARGSKVTDIVVLVVAADDGVMPQTLEAIDHARAAKVPIIVAVNKIDKADAQPDRVKKQLSDRGLMPEDWGGDTVTVDVSAKQRTNIPLLLEMILLVADIQDLKANPKRPAAGVVLEAKLDRGRGPVATVLVQNGTLRVGDPFIVGPVFSKVRALMDDHGRIVDEAPPSFPVEVLGLSSVPQAGDQFQVITDVIKAKQTAFYREQKQREQQLAASSRVTLEQLHAQLKSGSIRELPIILKADVQGSAEVVAEALQKIPSDKVRVKIIRSGVGAISESDVVLAMASNAVIIGFNVRPQSKAEELAEREKVDIRLHSIIYNVTDEVKKALTGLLEPATKEHHAGTADVKEVFRISKTGPVAGCMVRDGLIKRGADARVIRDGAIVYTGKVATLRRFKDEASEVRSGFECGLTMDRFPDLKSGDIVETFTIEKVQASLTS